MIKIMRERTLNNKLMDARAIGRSAGFEEAIAEIKAILQQKDKIEKMYFEPVTLLGHGGQTIQDCVFLGAPSPALSIMPLNLDTK